MLDRVNTLQMNKAKSINNTETAKCKMCSNGSDDKRVVLLINGK